MLTHHCASKQPEGHKYIYYESLAGRNGVCGDGSVFCFGLRQLLRRFCSFCVQPIIRSFVHKRLAAVRSSSVLESTHFSTAPPPTSTSSSLAHTYTGASRTALQGGGAVARHVAHAACVLSVLLLLLRSHPGEHEYQRCGGRRGHGVL